MKIIEILNKIANGEKVPLKIGWRDKIWNYDEREQDYINYWNNRGRWFMSNLNDIRTKDFITDEVEIIEDEEEIDIQKIKELLTLEDYECDKTDIRLNRDIINELVKAVKQLDKKVNSIEQK